VFVRFALSLLLSAALLAGCGGGGGGKRLSKEAYASNADAICAKYNQQVKKLDTPSNLDELAKVSNETIPILDNAIDDLRKLKPPASEQGIADRWISQVENLKNDLSEIRDKAKDNDMQGVQAVVPKAQEHNAQSNALATQLGMTVCNSD
jgi:hypothetical protein